MKSERKKKKTLLIILCILLALLLLAIGGVFFVWNYFYGKTHYVEDPSEITTRSGYEDETPPTDVTLPSPSEKPEDPTAPGVPVNPYTDKVYNILLVGADNAGHNSDAMILCSVNYTDGKIMLTSFMRDILANIPNLGPRRLNSAFAMSGPALLVQTLEQNFNIHIDNYAWVDFEGLKGLVNTVGGIDLPLTVKEASTLGISISQDEVVHLDGEKALLHARDRSSFGNDYQRTQRQRNVIMAIVNKLKSGSLGSLIDAANAILPFITHNIDSGTMAGLMFDLVKFSSYPISQQRIPYDGLYTSGTLYYLVPNYTETIPKLWEAIYD